ncbi:ABC transporter ATP-binding protein [Singulisphaera acidiphila]|uniref:ABC-type multidrug transport system, ATPase and permease component n=1 Tax=Singulisphaera acidiphila (strain ATCC BAA-1392 / DSM 18658 / VKM B-2454 / MOB10) TaxID=886293 RepID=L0DMZ7_SINAD|nr:ABC transporter ATP-binding protein [Singulisphaera acidiphila]AGA30213.1 ABC-type multidrug transport system, ATPase and permease component [Singulisphaera acidiphila DSM 18658]
MQADAYLRARKLLENRPKTLAIANVLGALHSLLILALLGVAGLLASLLASRGVAQMPTREVAKFPTWVTSRETGVVHDQTVFDDSGLFPLVAGNWSSPSVLHRQAARTLLKVIRRVPTLMNNVGALTSLLAMAAGLLLVISLIAQYRRSVLADAASEVATSLRRQIHRQMYRLGHSSLPTEGIGPVVNLLTREVNDIRDAIFTELDHSVRMPVLALGLLALSLFISPILTVFLASLGALNWLTSRVLNKDARLVSDAAMRDAAVQLCLLHEDLGLLRLVRVFGMENIDKQRFDEHLERFRDADSRRIKTEGRLNPANVLLYGASAILAISLLGYSVVVSHRLAPASALILVVSLAALIHPVLEWIQMRRTLRQANRSAEGIFEFLERKTELHQHGGAHFLPPMRDRVTLENVSLESRSGRVLLDGVSAEFRAGTRTAVMGLDEDAKLALACLIPRLIDPQVGRVRIDGQDLRDVTLESVRAQVAIVLQADLVFTDSVAMCIGLGDPSYSLPRIIEAAKVAHAHNFIQDLPHGYDTIIGPLGHYLEPDELYRIALARAYLHDPSIVIIEEPTGALDDDTKHLIDDTIARLGQNRTLIMLPHRLSTIRSCHQIIVLQNGRIESVGQPRQLQNESKLYRHLQYVEFNQFATGDIEAGQMNG